MNDTPRTDAEVFFTDVYWNETLAVVPASFARALERENAKLRELGSELRKSAEMIGYVQSADTYRDAVRRIEAWDAFTQLPTA
jgi:hypothetical protein